MDSSKVFLAFSTFYFFSCCFLRSLNLYSISQLSQRTLAYLLYPPQHTHLYHFLDALHTIFSFSIVFSTLVWSHACFNRPILASSSCHYSGCVKVCLWPMFQQAFRKFGTSTRPQRPMTPYHPLAPKRPNWHLAILFCLSLSLHSTKSWIPIVSFVPMWSWYGDSFRYTLLHSVECTYNISPEWLCFSPLTYTDDAHYRYQAFLFLFDHYVRIHTPSICLPYVFRTLRGIPYTTYRNVDPIFRSPSTIGRVSENPPAPLQFPHISIPSLLWQVLAINSKTHELGGVFCYSSDTTGD